MNYYFTNGFSMAEHLNPDSYIIYPSLFNFSFYPEQYENHQKNDHLSVKGTTDYERP
jgi:hypothetical protein